MSPHNGMLGSNRIPPCNPAFVKTVIYLLHARVYSSEAVQSLLKLRRKPLVRLGHISEQRIPAGGRSVEKIQESCPRWLLLECHVRVPSHRVGPVGQKLGAGTVIGAAVDKVDLRKALGSARGLMDVVGAEVATKVQGLVDGNSGQVLVAEN